MRGNGILTSYNVYTYEIKLASEKDSGIYSCFGMRKDGFIFVEHAEVFVGGK